MLTDNSIASIDAPLSAESELPLADLVRFIIKLFVHAFYTLFVLVDGLLFMDSYDARALTLPYFFAGFALVRAISQCLNAQNDLYAFSFTIGLSTLGAMV